LPLFNAVGFKIAVGNCATSDLAAKADYLAPALQDHPLKHVLKKFFGESVGVTLFES
jgi:hydroxymethylpyrimidine pyrophosphatase-like HAD family hydrolase